MLVIDEKCTGCRCCEFVCKQGAIKMLRDKEGFLFPNVDFDKCINCGVCEKRCPNNTIDKLNLKVDNAFAIVTKNKNILTNSSSGGMFSVIAEYVLSKNGVVFGAAFIENLKLQHIYIDNENDLKKLRGSKYFQSDVSDSYVLVKSFLEKKVFVYYTGTPCQVAGLKSFLNKDYDNLITSDLICHGVPSPLFFEKYRDFLEKKYKASLSSISFRKLNGWGVVEQFVLKNNRRTIKKSYADYCSKYLSSFLKGVLFRNSCYSCPYANLNRCGDITIGDFWGIQRFSKIDSKNGVSAVLLNSTKAKKIFDEIKDGVIYEIHPISHVTENNPNLLKPSPYIFLRKKIYEHISNFGIQKTMNKYLKIKNLNLKIMKYKTILFLEKIGIKDFVKRCLKK